MYPYTIIVEKAAGNYAAYSPDVDGCGTTGETVEETLSNMKEALEFHFEGLLETGEEIPQPKGLYYYMTNATETEPLFHSSTDIVAFIEPSILQFDASITA